MNHSTNNLKRVGYVFLKPSGVRRERAQRRKTGGAMAPRWGRAIRQQANMRGAAAPDGGIRQLADSVVERTHIRE